ncbi:CorA family divalent cation transporter [Nioella aestuarii]|uniref:CorA family divalent cation transporter n=1 Tax=Nioella aestuarii TaxID=1662864 RepID=UPI003D7FF552
MLRAFHCSGRALVDAPPSAAIWVDLFQPSEEETAALRGLGIAVPSLAEMEEIELSNRLYRDEETEVLTVVLTGEDDSGTQIVAPVAFILTPERLVTVRHHQPRPFSTYPGRAGHSSAGIDSPERLFLGLAQEIVARLADLLEGAGRVLDVTARRVFSGQTSSDAHALQETLREVGQQGEAIGRIRLALLTFERALSFFGSSDRDAAVSALIGGLMRDIEALSEHSDYLSSRIELTVDATLGMITLVQNSTVRIFSVVAVLFLPPTLVASIYGMNFAVMPELSQTWGYPAALLLMLASAVGCYVVFKWKKWL